MLPMASRPRKKLSSALALPDEAGELYRARVRIAEALPVVVEAAADHLHGFDAVVHFGNADGAGGLDRKSTRLLQSQSNLVCRLLLEKKKPIRVSPAADSHARHWV